MTKLGAQGGHVRAHNRRVVLQALRQGASNRADLARLSGLTAQSVSNIVAELIGDGLIVTTGRVRNGRGQPPLQLALNPTGAFSIGVEVRADGLVGVLTDLTGQVIRSDSEPLDQASPGHVPAALKRMVSRFLTPKRVAARALLGVGVVMPGPFGVTNGNVDRPTELPGWQGVDAAALLQAALRKPVRVENDATAAAIAEHLHGVARGLTRFASLYFGMGVGLGLILEGRPYVGATGNAGEIGHVVIEPGGRACFCGQRGCLERHVSLDAVFADFPQARRRQGGDPLAGLAGDAKFAAWLDRAAARLAGVILLLENVIDPQAVVIGGVSDVLVDGLAARLERLPAPLVPRGGQRVLRGATGPATAAQGAAALPLFDTTAAGVAAPVSAGRAA
jgi:predicted NBD/HSP70 family sugar kinase